jgi:RimJ/RimL family protein N-acetyltransferase
VAGFGIWPQFRESPGTCHRPKPASGAEKPGADGGRPLHYSLVTAVPELRNDGIILNAHNDSEVAAHLAGEDEETARRFGWWPARSTEETVRAAYATWARNWQEDGPVRAFAARDPRSGALVGNCELRIAPDGTGEVSYWTHAGKRGRGYASNALTLLVGYAASIGVTRLEANVAPDNHASRHVAEAAGFTQAGTFPDDSGTEFIRYTRDASGDGAAPFTKLGPDPGFARQQQNAAAAGSHVDLSPPSPGP